MLIIDLSHVHVPYTSASMGLELSLFSEHPSLSQLRLSRDVNILGMATWRIPRNGRRSPAIGRVR